MDILKKPQVEQHLLNKEFDKIAEAALINKSVIRYIFSFLYSTDDLLHWRAAEALGAIVSIQHQQGLDAERNIPRRLVWSLQEESGATAWPAPEALGAIVSQQPTNFDVFATIAISFIDDPVFQRGVLWAMRKVSEKRPDLTHDSAAIVIPLLMDTNPAIRGHAAWALGAMKLQQSVHELKKLLDDDAKLFIYDDHELQETTVGMLAQRSITELIRSFISN